MSYIRDNIDKDIIKRENELLAANPVTPADITPVFGTRGMNLTDGVYSIDNDNAASWNTGFKSSESFKGKCKLTFNWEHGGDVTAHTMFGLCDSTDNWNYPDIEYRWYFNYPENSESNIHNYQGYYTPDRQKNVVTTFGIEYFDDTINYTVDGNIVTTIKTTKDREFFIKAAYHSNVKISNVVFTDKFVPSSNLANGIRRIVHHNNYNRIDTDSTDYSEIIGTRFDYNTDKYNYIITTTHSVNSGDNSDTGGGTNIQLQIGGAAVVSSGHRGYDMQHGSYLTNVLTSNIITSGFTGNYYTRTLIAAYESGKAIHNHDNGGANSPNDEQDNRNVITITELYK